MQVKAAKTSQPNRARSGKTSDWSFPTLIVQRVKFENGSTQRFDVYDGKGRWLCSMKPSERVVDRATVIAQAMFQLANLAGNPHLSEQDAGVGILACC